MNGYSSSTTSSGQASDEGERSDDSRSSPDGQRAGYPEASSEGQGLCNAGPDSGASTSEGQMASPRNDGSNSLTCTPGEEDMKYLTHASASPQVNENSIDFLSDSHTSDMSKELHTLQEQDNTSVVQTWDDESQNRDAIFQSGVVGVENSEAGFENGDTGHQNGGAGIQTLGVGIQSSDAGIENVDSGTGGVMLDIRTQRRIHVLESDEMERFLNHERIGPIVATEQSDDHHPMERMSTIGDDAVNNPQPNCVQIGSRQQLLLSIEECMANKSTYALRNRISGVILSNQDTIRSIGGQFELGYEYTPWDNTRYGLDDRVMRCKDMWTNCKFIMKKYYPCNFNRWEVELPIRSRLSVFPCVLGLVWSQDGIQVFQESLDGIVLSELLKQRPILSGGEVDWLIFNMLKELGPIHQKGIIHRNLTPENIIISRTKVKLYMVGGSSLCKIRDCLSISPRRTLHSSPEIASATDHHWSTDIYSVGTIAHTCLSGEFSFFPIGRQQRNLENCIFEIGSGRYPVSNYLAGIEQSWQPMISTLTHPDMSKRPSANDLLRNYQEPEWQEGFFHPSFNPQEERPLPEIGDRVVNIPSDEILFSLGDDEIGEGNESVDENEESERDENTGGSDATEQTYLVDQPQAPKKVESRVSSDSGNKTSPLNMFTALSLKDVPSFSSAAGLARQTAASERASTSRDQSMAPSSSEQGSPSTNQSMAPSSTRTQVYSRQSSEDENDFSITVTENERDIGVVRLPRESYGRDLVKKVQATFKLKCGVTLRFQEKIIKLEDNLKIIFVIRDVTVKMERIIRDLLLPRQDLSNTSRSLPNIPTSGINKVKAAFVSSSLPYVLQPGGAGTKINPQVNQSDGACTSSRSEAAAQDVPDDALADEDVPDITPAQDVPDDALADEDVPDITSAQDVPDDALEDEDVPDITSAQEDAGIVHVTQNVSNISSATNDVSNMNHVFHDVAAIIPEETKEKITIIDGNASAVVGSSVAATDADDADDEGDDEDDDEDEEDEDYEDEDDEEDEDDNGIPSVAEDRGQQNSGSDDADDLENEREEEQDNDDDIQTVTKDYLSGTQTTSHRSRQRSVGAQELSLEEDLEDATKGSQIQNDNNSDDTEEKPDVEDVILDEANGDSCDDEKASDFALDSSNVTLSEGNLNDTTGTGEDDQTENEDEFDAADAVLEASGVDSDEDSKELKTSVFAECSHNTFSEESNLFETTGTGEEIDDNAENEDDAVQEKSEECSIDMNDSGIGQNSSNDTFSEVATLTDEAFSPMSERDSFED